MFKSKLSIIGLILFLFILRLIFGLCAEFWFEDELQIYLIGLKSFTTHTWPYFGPDVVYTQTQIPGALQGLLVSIPFYICSIPESPSILLNILTFLSLLAFAFYTSKRILSIPKWLIISWAMLLTWTMDYGTRVVNPSYVLVFSIPFFIALFELLPIYKTAIISRRFSYLTLGLTPALIMQLHLSYILLVPLILLVFFFEWKSKREIKLKINYLLFFFIGMLLGISTLIPTYLYVENWKSTSSNIVFNIENLKNVVTILARYLSFASFEVPYILGGSTSQRLAVIQSNIWVTPFAIYLLLFGFLLIGAYIFVFIKNKNEDAWRKIKYLTLGIYVLTFFSFFFSIKGPSSHTFFIVFPMVTFYSFYCHAWLLEKYKYWKHFMLTALISCLFFYTSLAIFNYHNKSIYKDRARVVKAINEKNYKTLGNRRSETWQNGY